MKTPKIERPTPEAPESLHWSVASESDDFLGLEFAAKHWFRHGLPVIVLLTSTATIGAFQLARSASALPPVYGFVSGNLFAGKVVSRDSLTAEDFYPQFRDTVKYLFYRTEKGVLPEIADFVTPEYFAGAKVNYENIKGKYPGGFVQTLEISGERHETSNATATYRQVKYACTLNSRSVDGAQTSSVYLLAGFQRRDAEGMNASGWKLVQLYKTSPDSYYKEEHRAELDRRLGLPEAGPANTETPTNP